MPVQGERHPDNPDVFWSAFYSAWRLDSNGRHKIDREMQRKHGWTPAVHARDLAAALADEEEMARQDPTAPKPRHMLERLRIVGDDRLTATDNALYEALLATARKAGLDQGKRYELDGDVAKAYLGASRWIDVRRSVDRLVDTRVQFSIRTELFREAGTVPMLIAHTREGLGPMRGKNSVRFEFPSILMTVMFAARLYGRVELKAFPKFGSKYSGRLYGLAASHASRGHFTMSPSKLADALGWSAEKFHFGSFEQRCLRLAMGDIAAHVTRIAVSYESVRGSGRGRPVEKLAFTVTELEPQRFNETKTVRMEREDYFAIKQTDTVHPPELIPSARLVGRAMRKHLKSSKRWATREIAERRERPLHLVAWAWREALDEAKFGTPAALSERYAHDHIVGLELLSAIDRDGLELTFQRWLDAEIAWPRCLSLATRRMGPNGGEYLLHRSQNATAPVTGSRMLNALIEAQERNAFKDRLFATDKDDDDRPVDHPADDDLRMAADFGDIEDEPDFDFLPTGDDEPDQDDDIAF